MLYRDGQDLFAKVIFNCKAIFRFMMFVFKIKKMLIYPGTYLIRQILTTIYQKYLSYVFSK